MMDLHICIPGNIDGGSLLVTFPVRYIGKPSKVKVLFLEASGFPGLEQPDLIQFLGHIKRNLIGTGTLNVDEDFVNLRTVVNHAAGHFPTIMCDEGLLSRSQLQTAHTAESWADKLTFREFPSFSGLKSDHITAVSRDSSVTIMKTELVRILASDNQPWVIQPGLLVQCTNPCSNNGALG